MSRLEDASATMGEELQVQRRDSAVEHHRLYDGDGVVELEHYFQGISRMRSRVVRYLLTPGASEGVHFHADDDPDSCTAGSSEELYVVTSGEVCIQTDADEVVLRAGDAFYAPAGLPHGIVNRSESSAEIVLIFD